MALVIQPKQSTVLGANEHPLAGLFDGRHKHAFQTKECPTATLRLFCACIGRYRERTIAAGSNASDKGTCSHHTGIHDLSP
jgi:hypothetical protein